MSFFSRKRQPSVQVSNVQAAQQQQNFREQQMRQQQQQQQAREREFKERELDRERERERERERLANEASNPVQQSSPPTRQSPSQNPQLLSQSLSQSQGQNPSPLDQAGQGGTLQQAPGPPQKPSPPQGVNSPNPPTRPAYPWAARRLALQPVASLSRAASPMASPSPFPRYGHSLPPVASASGELFLFGGLVKEQVKNDLYSFSTRDLSATLIETKGEIPPARVGHASALVSSVLIVWGGDTKTNDADKQDEGLYLLNLGTREWTRVSTMGPAPVGRYGHSVTMYGTRFFVFGGQVDGEFKNDLWAFDLSSLKTPDPTWELYSRSSEGSTEAPAPRTGHVCVTCADKIYLFGGTDGQYHYNDTWAFDVPTRTWKELSCIGFIPVPREGHAAALVDDVMYVFGGRGVDGKDLGDLAAFKISNSRWYMFQNMGPAPSGRSGHAMAASGSRVFVLGGESFTSVKPDDPSIIHMLDSRHIKYPESNGRSASAQGAPQGRRPSERPQNGQGQPPNASQPSQRQQQLQQQSVQPASTPSPPSTSKPLASTTGFNAPKMANGGTGPSSRDRALSPTSVASSATAARSAIPKPGDGRERDRDRDRALSPTGRSPPDRSAQRAVSPQSVTSDVGQGQPPPQQQNQRATSPSNKPPNGTTFALGAGAAAMANDRANPSPQPAVIANAPAKSKPPPPRPPRRDDENAYGLTMDRDRNRDRDKGEEGESSAEGAVPKERAMSPSGPGSSVNHGRAPSPSGPSGTSSNVNHGRASSPPGPSGTSSSVSHGRAPSPSGPSGINHGRAPSPSAPSAPSAPSTYSAPSAPSGTGSSINHGRTISPTPIVKGPSPILGRVPNGLAARSPSPVVTAPPPQDAFYYSNPSTAVITSAPRTPPMVNGHSSFARNSAGNVVADMLKAKEAELEGMKRRENWMKAALARATKAGFVWADGDLQESRVGSWIGRDGDEEDRSSLYGGNGESDNRKMADTVMKMKQEYSRIQMAVSQQAQLASERLTDAERMRNGAVQEAGFYRAKLAAYETGNNTEVTRLERDRLNHIESQLQSLVTERNTTERKLEEALEGQALQTRLREHAEERVADALRRAEASEEANDQLRREFSELREQHITVETSLRDHADRLVSATSTTQQLEADHHAARSHVEDLTRSRDEHQRALAQAHAALEAAGSRASELDSQWQEAREQIRQLENELLDVRNDLEGRIQEAESANARLADAENAWAKSREEADAYRAMTTGSLGTLLDTQKEMLADEDRSKRGHAEKVRAMEVESSSLRKMLKEAGQRVDTAQNNLAEQRDKHRALQTNTSTLRAQIVGLRSQLAIAVADTGRLRKDLSVREHELREKSKSAADTEVRLGMLRNYLADNGLVVDEEDMTSSQSSGSNGSRLQQLQQQAQQSKQEHQDLELRIQDIQREKEDAESKVRSLTSKLDQARNSTVRSPTSAEDGQGRVMAAERRLAEAETAHREKMQTMERDYQTAVQYVKGTEKMLKRMKEELTKQKGLNSSLQSELDSSRGVNGMEAGSRTRNANGRNTPLSDDDGNRAQLAEAHRQNQRLGMENQDLHRRLENLQADIEELRDNLLATERNSEARLQHAEEEIERLETALRSAQDGEDETVLEQLIHENTALKAENKLLSDKINLLLEVDQPGYDGENNRISGMSERRASHSSSENAMAFESLSNELDDWQRRLASTSRPVSDYDEAPRHNTIERLR
ncbi:Negative regulator of mitotic exit [Tulasnella sp. JGI-2019a]|nr:Negative regulator of mitotic exit [Tulasnella sp. JGI-2019a]